MRERWEIERSVPICVDGDTKDAVEECNRHTLEVLLDIRDLLIEIRDQSKETVIDFVPPDYGKEDKLV